MNTIVKYASVIGLASFSIFANAGNKQIREEYRKIESSLICAIQTWEDLSVKRDSLVLLNLGYIRSFSSIPHAIKYLDFRGRGREVSKIPDGCLSNITTTVAGVKIYNAGPYSALRDVYPAFKALLRTGISFASPCKYLTAQNSGNAVFMISCLLRLNSGDYFNYVVNTEVKELKAAPGFGLVEKIVLHSGIASEISRYTLGNSSIAEQYDCWQDELISRFKSQLENGDAELADTIHTMGFIRSDKAMSLLIENLTVCPQASTNSPSGLVFPAAEALISIWPPLGICFEKLKASAPMSLDESLWLRIIHEVYPEAVEYDLMKKAEQGDKRAARLLASLPWRRLGALKSDSENPAPAGLQ